LKGFYTSKKGTLIPFTAVFNSGVVGILFTGFSASLAQANIGNGYMLHVTNQSFEDFKSRVLDKPDVEWTNATIMPGNVNVNVPGTWRSDDGNKKTVITGDEETKVFDRAIKGYGGSRKHTHRKPTKRRRTRRVYRKPKKN
jgi:hypothetical protein